MPDRTAKFLVPFSCFVAGEIGPIPWWLGSLLDALSNMTWDVGMEVFGV